MAPTEVMAIGVLDYQNGKEGFDAGVFVAFGSTTHGRNDVMGSELVPETFAGELHAAVGVQQQTYQS